MKIVRKEWQPCRTGARAAEPDVELQIRSLEEESSNLRMKIVAHSNAVARLERRLTSEMDVAGFVFAALNVIDNRVAYGRWFGAHPDNVYDARGA